MSMGRKILAVVLGTVTAGLAIAGVEMLAHGRITGDALFAAVAAGYGLGAFGGSLVAFRLSGARWTAVAVTAILALLAIGNLFALPHPMWFVPVAAVTLAAGHAAAIAVSRRSGGQALS
ncbi:hypothetical protein B5J99_17460 [Blastomonas fulva]|uniref:Major facilitator superfamily (MFS) profile domain-containing protein n=2 Tax=Blastomonas fulva TaxID=1550728 RepID=A0ABM6MAW3_9SPHN|nr:hypothetical protein B5J99_17460 [Blastomonas fulva]